MAGSAAGADRQSRKSGGLHPKGPTKCRTRGLPWVAARRCGTNGERRRPRQFESRRQKNAAAPGAATAASPARSAARPDRADQKRTLESGRPARRRARGRVRQPPPCLPAGSRVRRGKTKALRPLAASQKPASARSIDPRSAAGTRRPGSIPVDQPSAIIIRMAETTQRDSAPRSGVERGHARGVGRFEISASKSSLRQGMSFYARGRLVASGIATPLAPSDQIPILFAGSQSNALRIMP